MVSIIKDIHASDPVKGIPVPTQAYVFYEDGGGVCAATEHRVVNGALRPGRVVSMRSLSDRFAKAARNDRPTILPERVFISSSRLFAWISPERYAPMWFSMHGRQWAYRVWWPKLLWAVQRQQRTLSLYATGKSSRPTAETILYHAPLMNIGSEGTLCEGSARLPRTLDESRIDDIETCVYGSNFSHVNHASTLKGGADDRRHVAYWRDKERSKMPVRVAELNRLGRLQDILR